MRPFIVIEGGEGVGKSTLIRQLEARIKYKYHKEVYVTREPGGTPFAEDIRKLLLSGSTDNKWEQFLLVMTARHSHYKVIDEQLAQGNVVLCDRFYLSSIVYQLWDVYEKACRQKSELPAYLLDLYLELSSRFLPRIDSMQTYNIILDMPAEKALERKQKDKAEAGQRYFDDKPLAFHKQIRTRFRALSGVTWAGHAELVNVNNKSATEVSASVMDRLDRLGAFK